MTITGIREKVEANGSVENIQEKHYRRSMRKEDDWCWCFFWKVFNCVYILPDEH